MKSSEFFVVLITKGSYLKLWETNDDDNLFSSLPPVKVFISANLFWRKILINNSEVVCFSSAEHNKVRTCKLQLVAVFLMEIHLAFCDSCESPLIIRVSSQQLRFIGSNDLEALFALGFVSQGVLSPHP